MLNLLHWQMKKLLLIFLTSLLAMSIETYPRVVFPPALKEGDTIAILAPSGPVKREYVDKTADVLFEEGYVPVIYPTVDMHNGQFSGTAAQRLADLRKALLDPGVKAILCARGGYGMVHNLDSLAALPLEKNPKWVIGYSDISALHALLASKGIASIHASMARHIARGADEPENRRLFEILRDTFPTYSLPIDPRNHLGRAEGMLLGGNLSVIQALINTPYDVIRPGTILFIEDVSEPVYKIERIMYQLRMSGILDRLSGLVIGRFTDYKPDENHGSMESMIAEVLRDYPDLPVAFQAPVGHVSYNEPLVVSADALLDVSKNSVTLQLKRPQQTP